MSFVSLGSKLNCVFDHIADNGLGIIETTTTETWLYKVTKQQCQWLTRVYVEKLVKRLDVINGG